MSTPDEQLEEVWLQLKPAVPEDDPLKADVEEYLAAGEWGIAAEAMAILSKRYGQDETILPLLEPVMMRLIAQEAEKEGAED